jgi:hypothetical protein
MERTAILRLLNEKFDRAQQQRTVASQEFDEAMSNMSRGGTSIEKVQRLHSASAQYSHALQAFYEALRDKNDFLLHGSIPASLERKPCGAENAASTGEKTG